MMTEIYRHTPLAQTRSTRVIKVVASQAPVIRVQLLEVSIDSFQYDALSYTWEAQQQELYVLCEGMRLPVTRNCEAALRNISQVRNKRGDFYIWIDAVCINQQDVEERNQQVGMMADIYESANIVHIWLGEGSPYSKLIFKYERRYSFIEKWSPKLASWYAKNCGKTLQRNEQTQLVSALAQHSWFYRVWTIQELVNAALPLAWCGDKHTGFDHLSLFLVCLSKWCNYGANHNELADQVQGHLHTRWKLRTIKFGFVGTPAFDIVDFMTKVRICGATEPKDKIFAIQGILSELGVKLPIPDYAKPLGLIYLETTRILIETESSLNILTLVTGILKPGLEAPSWVPDFSDNFPPDGVTECLGQGMANTTLNSVSTYRFDNTSKLLVRGRIIDKVEWSSNLQTWCPDHNPGPVEDIVGMLLSSDPLNQVKTIQALQNWALKARGLNPRKPTGQVWEEAMINILLRHIRSVYPPGEATTLFSFIILSNIKDIGTGLDFLEREIFESSNAGKEPFEVLFPIEPLDEVRIFRAFYLLERELLAHLLTRCRRNTFFTTENGYMGMGSLAIRQEDLVVLVPGLPTPMVMRPDGDYHRIIAPAWVHGIMDGTYWEQLCASNSEDGRDGLKEFVFI